LFIYTAMGCSSSQPASSPYISVTPPPPAPESIPVGTAIGGSGPSTTTFRCRCGNCGNEFLVSQVGVRVSCPQCGSLNDIPDAPPPASLPPAPSKSKTHHLLETSDSKTIECIKEALDGVEKRPCKYGLGCYRRKGEHLDAFYHPDDDKYALSLWKHPEIKGEFLTLTQCMKFMDPFDKGIIDDKQLLGELLKHIQGNAAPQEDALDKIWSDIDDDGNGYASFSEFVEWADQYGLKLPVGMEEKNNGTSRQSSAMGLKCGFPGCTGGRGGQSCTCFKPRRDDHRICVCGHKRSVHTVNDDVSNIAVPAYWQNKEQTNWKGAEWVDCSDRVAEFQALIDGSLKRVWTRDRGRDSGGSQKPVPTGYNVKLVKRNENKKIWRKYWLKKRLIQANILTLDETTPFVPYTVKTASSSFSDLSEEPLDQNCNEWLLWHGTSLEGAHSICEEDFKLGDMAGSATGTLYGPGTYFAESSTKSDEYAKESLVDGRRLYTMLLCRVIGGLVKYTDEVEPNAQDLTDACLHGRYDSVIGDREKCRNTFREFVSFSSDVVYPEYIIHYERQY